MESHRTTSKAGGWFLVAVAYLVGLIGILFSLGEAFLILFVAEMKPAARLESALICGLIFAVAVLCLFLGRLQAKKLRSRC